MNALQHLLTVASAAAKLTKKKRPRRHNIYRVSKVQLLTSSTAKEKENIEPAEEVKIVCKPSKECAIVSPLASATMTNVLLTEAAVTTVSANRKSRVC